MLDESDYSDQASDYEASTDDGEADHLSSGDDDSDSDEVTDVVTGNAAAIQAGAVPQPRSFLSKNKQERWGAVPVAAQGRQQVQNIMRQRQGLSRYSIQRVQSLTSAFDLFLRPAIMRTIVSMSNKEGQSVYGDNWKDIDEDEFKRFLGLLILAGVYRGHNEPAVQLWSKKSGRAVFNATMARNRFQQISRVLRFDDAGARRTTQRSADKLAPIRDVFEAWVATLSEAYVPGDNLTVDEQLVTTRGRCPFRQYLPSKPGKYGIKLWALCDSANSFVLNMQIYTGRAPNQPREVNQGTRVVLDLVRGFEKTGRNVTADNFFTHLHLANQLLDKGFSLLGTVRKNRTELPPEFVSTRNRQQYSSLFGFQNHATIVSYCPQKGKLVTLLSTMHHDDAVTQREDRKPDMIMDYNRTKGGVGTMDQLVRTYTTKRKTRRWPMVVFYDMLDVTALNAYIVWLKVNPEYQTGKNHKRRLFLEELGLELAGQAILPATGAAGQQEDQADSGQATGGAKRGRCYLCPRSLDKKQRTKCSKCKQFICGNHSVVTCGNH